MLRGAHIDSWVLLGGLITGLAAAYFAAAGIMLHAAYHSFGWDLGIFDQLIWNTAQGRWFEYSFRDYNYLGDHFQPALLPLATIPLLGGGPEALLAFQGFAFAAAAVPLFAAAHGLSDRRTAFFLACSYLLSLGVARALMYDFHLECVVPFLAFTALLGLVRKSPILFMAPALSLLLVKEDMFLLVLGLCWVAALGFGQIRAATATAAAAISYAALLMLFVMPHFLGDNNNPLIERYGFLGGSAGEIAVNALLNPLPIAEHLARWSSLASVVLVLAGVAFLPLAVPRLLPPLALLVAVPMLAEYGPQSRLELHYLVVPGTFALVLATVALRTEGSPFLGRLRPFAGPAVLASAALLFALLSPLPPSFSGDAARLDTGRHQAIADSMVDLIPDDAPVSAHAAYVPHLSQRRAIFEFPQVKNAEWVIIDSTKPMPSYDTENYSACLRELPALGFRIVASSNGITVWRRDTASAAPSFCF